MDSSEPLILSTSSASRIAISAACGISALLFGGVAVAAIIAGQAAWFAAGAGVLAAAGIAASIFALTQARAYRVVLSATELEVTTSRRHAVIKLADIERVVDASDNDVRVETQHITTIVDSLLFTSLRHRTEFIRVLNERINAARANGRG